MAKLIRKSNLFISVPRSILRVMMTAVTHPAWVIPKSVLAWLFHHLKCRHVLQIAPFREFCEGAVSILTHPAYATLGFRTQSILAMEWFEKPVLAMVTCDEIAKVVRIQDNRDLHPNKVPPFYMCMHEDDLWRLPVQWRVWVASVAKHATLDRARVSWPFLNSRLS